MLPSQNNGVAAYSSRRRWRDSAILPSIQNNGVAAYSSRRRWRDSAMLPSIQNNGNTRKSACEVEYITPSQAHTQALFANRVQPWAPALRQMRQDCLRHLIRVEERGRSGGQVSGPRTPRDGLTDGRLNSIRRLRKSQRIA